MTAAENLPAVPDAPSREVATLDTDSWVEVAKPIFALASRIYDTEFVPKGLRGSEPATAAAMLYGREIGLPPMTSLGGIHVIEGKPGLSAEQMRAMVFAAGHEIEFTESTGATCTIRGRRRGQERWTAVTWTVDMARAAGLGNRPIWKSYPRTQLQARATTELCRMIFPDVIHGFRSVEELDDMGDANGTEAGAPAASGSSKVSRQRRPRKTAQTPEGGGGSGAGIAATVERPSPSPSGPPLPGEPGYDEDTVAAAAPETAGEEDGTDAATRDAATGEDPTPSPAPTSGEAPVEQPAAASPDPDQEPKPQPVPRQPSRAAMRMLMGTLGGFGISGDAEREERLLVATTILGREIETFNDLTADDVKTLIDALAHVKDREALNRLLDEYDAAKAAQAEQDDVDEAAKGDES